MIAGAFTPCSTEDGAGRTQPHQGGSTPHQWRITLSEWTYRAKATTD